MARSRTVPSKPKSKRVRRGRSAASAASPASRSKPKRSRKPARPRKPSAASTRSALRRRARRRLIRGGRRRPVAAPAKRRHLATSLSSAPVSVPALQLPEAPLYVPQLSPRQASGERLRLLYLVHCFYPESHTGTEKFVLSMARAMQQRGHYVVVATYSATVPDDVPNAIGDIVYRTYEYEGVPVIAYRHRIADPGLSFAIDDPSLSAFADHILAQEQPSLIHIGHAMRAMAFTQAAQRTGIPYVLTLTDFWFICPKSILMHTDRNLCAGPEQGAACLAHCQIDFVAGRLSTHVPILQAAQRILSPSAFLASMVRSVAPEANVEIIRHGMRFETLAPNAKTYQADSPITLLYGGSLNDHKGVHVLIDAVKMIASRRLRLLIYGNGSPIYTEQIRKLAAGDRRIIFRGTYAEADLPRLYQEADLAIVPSVWYENYPLALHEALASHVPVIASGVGGMAEKIVDGVNGYTFRVGDARDLARRIKLVLRNPAVLNELKTNIRNMPLPSLEEEAAAYETVYYAHAR